MTKQIFKTFAFLFIALLITSCGGDDDDVTGTYKLYSYGTTSCDDPTNNLSIEVDDDGCSDVAGLEVCLTGAITLSSDNTFVVDAMISSTVFSEDLSGTGQYTATGNTITICDDEECFDGRVSGDEIILTIPAEDGCLLTIKGRK